MNGIYGLLWLLALFIWGDWRNFNKYYPTFLFFLLGDFLYLYMLNDYYPMWKYIPKGVDSEIGITDTHVSLSIMAIKYPATIAIFLGRFPEEKGRTRQYLYILIWVLIYTLNEFADLSLGLIKYYNGWNLGWSILFNIVMFSIIRLHHLKPLPAWVVSIIFVILLWNIFDVPSSVFR
ncbi:CBO0543 family protein [Fredinandcohnia sp. 179-A 10B2 NHS]|uniref:CBO0543 family protein n=1 Tax=Fredinandcohnia sp. 179-A 10B2 NHS TaxID=3235176 RepID=UPI0039A2C2C2